LLGNDKGVEQVEEEEEEEEGGEEEENKEKRDRGGGVTSITTKEGGDNCRAKRGKEGEERYKSGPTIRTSWT